MASKTTCSIDGCGNIGKMTRGWCPMHYQRWRKYGDPNFAPGPPRKSRGKMKQHRPCAVDYCDRPIIAKGFCPRHWLRNDMHGDPLAGRSDFVGRGEPWLRDAVANRDRSTCWEWPFSRQNGYGSWIENGQKYWAHRMCCEFDGRPIPDELLARHQCHNRSCCNPDHILPGTSQDNSNDSKRDGRTQRGEARWNAKLTEEQVLEIAQLQGQKIGQVAKRFGVTRATIHAIYKGKSWSWLTGIEKQDQLLR